MLKLYGKNNKMKKRWKKNEEAFLSFSLSLQEELYITPTFFSLVCVYSVYGVVDDDDNDEKLFAFFFY